MPLSFPCPACGAPVEPESDKKQMACSYCGVTVTIPDNLRSKKAPPPPPVRETLTRFDPHARAKQAFTPEMREESLSRSQKINRFMRNIAPFASGLYVNYARWILLKGMIPALLILFAICCLLSMSAGGLLVYYLRTQ